MPNEADGREADGSVDAHPEVVSLRTRPERRVFSERGNTDGWIATDLTVEVEP